MRNFSRKLVALLLAGAAVLAVLAGIIEGGYYYVEPSLPPRGELKNVQLKIPLRIYSRDGRLMAQYGNQMRTPAPYDQIPQLLITAVLDAEDDRFFQHSGLDFIGTAHAIFRFVITGGKRVPGGSTITQQVARTTNLVSRDYSLVRKFKEWILAFRLEREFTKQEILQIYLNTTFFGQRSYGVVAAARTYFGKTLDELTLSEAAIIAGIPQGPSIMNPVASPENAARRRAYVLRRMHELGDITTAQYDTALAVPIESRRHGLELEVSARYVAEMARAEMVRRFGRTAYTAGLRVTTTVDSRLQRASNAAIKSTLSAYDRRHGYRGAIGHVKLPEALATGSAEDATARQAALESLAATLDDYPTVKGLVAGVVLDAASDTGEVYLPKAGVQKIDLTAVAWARPYINQNRAGAAPKAVSDVLAAGDIVRFRHRADGSIELAQLPEVQGAFVALDPQDGAIVALNGGYDFFLSNYNRATQSLRQPGSSFKPFVYSAALEHGFTTATIVNDAPLTIQDPGLETAWKPENYGHEYFGQVRLREALVHSLNAASVRVIMKAGIPETVQYMQRFGFNKAALPVNATLALGAGGVPPLDVAAGYAIFANGGRRVTPYFIDRVEDVEGNLLYQAQPAIACIQSLPGQATGRRDCQRPGETDAPTNEQGQPQLIDHVTDLYPELRVAPRAITAQNAYLVTDMMHDVVRRGTAAAAGRELERTDLSGKTGTTNDRRDAWFSGFNADIVGTAWVGFDQNRTLGGNEQGAVTALPMWIDFMRTALATLPEHEPKRPSGIVDVRINPVNGLVATGDDPNSQFEMFRIGHVPAKEPDSSYRADATGKGKGDSDKTAVESIF